MKATGKKVAAAFGIFCYAAAFLFVANLLEYGPVKIFRYEILAAALFYLAVLDIKSRIVPNRFLLILAAVRILCFLPEAVLYPGYLGGFLTASLFGAGAAMLILIVGNFICRQGMGYGDIKLFGVIGFYTGPQTVLGVLFFSLIFAAAYSIVFMLMKKIKAKDEIPFVPFAAAGFAIAGLLGV